MNQWGKIINLKSKREKMIAETLLFVALFVIYFLPTFNAAGKKHLWGVFALNLFLGWTIVGWVVAFIWSFNNYDR